MLKNMIGAVAFIIAIPLILALFLTKDYKVQREVVINKPVASVFDYIKLVKNQPDYAKWTKGDTAMLITSTGTDGTAGYVSYWQSNNKDIGKGEQRITKVTEGSEADVVITFTQPMQEVQTNYFTTEAITSAQTKVKWVMTGRMEYPMNFLMLFVNVDNIMGAGLANGLQRIKTNMEMAK